MKRIENLAVGQIQQSGVVANASFSLATAAGGAQTVSIQLEDGFGYDVAEKTCVQVYLSSSAVGDGIDGAADSLAGGTDGSVLSLATGKLALCQSESDGDIDIAVADSTSAATWYMVVVLPNGKRVVSGAIIPTPAG